MYRIATLFTAISFIAACDQQASNPESADTTDISAAETTSMDAIPSMAEILSNFDREQVAADVMQHTEVLSTDEYEGRAPATKGEELTIAYLENAFKEVGVQPGNNGSYFQTVPVTEITTDPNTSLTLAGTDYSVELAYQEHMMVGTQQQIDSIAVSDSELVFVDTLWPDFTREHLAHAVADYQKRERRYGATTA